MHGRDDIYIQNSGLETWRKEHVEDLGVDERIILKYKLKKSIMRM
jgi:hypothetical protein